MDAIVIHAHVSALLVDSSHTALYRLLPQAYVRISALERSTLQQSANTSNVRVSEREMRPLDVLVTVDSVL